MGSVRWAGCLETLTLPGRLPSFLIIGAPKSGTTSLVRYLQHHPDVFILAEEEPEYFSFAGARPRFSSPDAATVTARACWRLEDYRNLFSQWDEQKMGGEKSAVYLSSVSAPRAMFETVPDAHLIAILRNPADRAFSHFLHNRRSTYEPLADFEAALEAESERKALGWSYSYRYREQGRYAEQLSRYYALFPKEQLMVLLFDDLATDPRAVMRAVCRHLDITEDCGLPVDERHNVSKGVPRNKFLHRLLTRESLLKAGGRMLLPAAAQKVVWWKLFRLNTASVPQFDRRVRQQLQDYYRADISQLEELIGRDLSGWLKG